MIGITFCYFFKERETKFKGILYTIQIIIKIVVTSLRLVFHKTQYWFCELFLDSFRRAGVCTFFKSA